MSNRFFLGMIVILAIILLSIEQPIIYPFNFHQRIPNNQIPIDFQCVSENLPDGAIVLYFSNADGSLTMEEKFGGEYFLLQYQLAPRLLAVYRNTPGDFSVYDWFIALRYDEVQLAELASHYGLSLISRCGDFTILQQVE